MTQENGLSITATHILWALLFVFCFCFWTFVILSDRIVQSERLLDVVDTTLERHLQDIKNGGQ